MTTQDVSLILAALALSGAAFTLIFALIVSIIDLIRH